jgi:hypothetical protein
MIDELIIDRGVKCLVAKLFADDTFRKQFNENPEAAMRSSGCPLSDEDIEVLMSPAVLDQLVGLELKVKRSKDGQIFRIWHGG